MRMVQMIIQREVLELSHSLLNKFTSDNWMLNNPNNVPYDTFSNYLNWKGKNYKSLFYLPPKSLFTSRIYPDLYTYTVMKVFYDPVI